MNLYSEITRAIRITAQRKPVSVNPRYEVDEYGRIYKDGVTMTPMKNNWQYWFVSIEISDRKFKNVYVAHLVAAAFVENPHNYSMIDHIDRNKDNNHYSNLRWCTSQHNNRNRSKCGSIKRKCTSKYKGVGWHKKWNKWRARIMVDKDSRKEIALGSFDNEEDAARAYNKAAIEMFGEHAALNVFE